MKIIWQFHTHTVHQKVSRLFGPRYIGDDFYLGPNLVSFNRAVVPLFELSPSKCSTKPIANLLTYILLAVKPGVTVTLATLGVVS